MLFEGDNTWNILKKQSKFRQINKHVKNISGCIMCYDYFSYLLTNIASCVMFGHYIMPCFVLLLKHGCFSLHLWLDWCLWGYIFQRSVKKQKKQVWAYSLTEVIHKRAINRVSVCFVRCFPWIQSLGLRSIREKVLVGVKGRDCIASH